MPLFNKKITCQTLVRSNITMRKELLISIIASIPLFGMCDQIEGQSPLQNITEMSRIYCQDSVRSLMHNCECIFLRSHSPRHEGYALCIPTKRMKQMEKCYFNVIISATATKKNAERQRKENDEWKYTFKINDDRLEKDTTFYSLEKDSSLFEKLYGRKASDMIKLIEFCRKYAITKVQLCSENTISMETPEFHLYNSSECDTMYYRHLSENWHYEYSR